MRTIGTWVSRAGWLGLAFALTACSFHVAPVALAGRDGGGVGGDGESFPRDGGLAADGAVSDGATRDGPTDLASAGPFLAVTPATPAATIDLSLEGSADWAHWGFTFAGDFDHKATGNGQISNFTSVGVNAPTQYGDNLVAYRWNDGLPGSGRHAMAGGKGSTTGVYVLTGGFKIVAPAGPTVRRLRIYVGAFKAQGRLDAALGDGSAPAYSDASFTSTNTPVNAVYVITYAAATPGQQLVVQWTIANSQFGGNITLQSATLQDGPL